MVRSTIFKLPFTWEDEVDVTIQKEDGKIIAFSVNYRTNIDDKWHSVIRYDTAHGRMHVHKFWISPKIMPLKEYAATDTKKIIIEAIKDIKLNWKTYKTYLIKKVGRNGK